MLKNRKLSRAISESLFGITRTMLTYKCNLYKNTLIVAPRTFASTQTCCMCGNRKEGDDKLTLKDREYDCEVCGNVMDRDDNASLTLRN